MTQTPQRQASNEKQDWDQAQNILCVRLDQLGDVLMSTPAIRALKNSVPARRITLLSSASGSAAAPYVPELHDAIVYAAPWMKSSGPHNSAIDLALIRMLQSRRFDAAVIFTSYSQSPLPAALLCTLADIPLRVAHCRENPYHLLSDWVRDPEPHDKVRHEVRRQLDLVAAVGSHTREQRLSFSIPAADIAWARQRLDALDIDPAQPWLLLHPGASAPSRRYPASQWRDVADRFATTLHCPLVFTGAASETALIALIRHAMDAPSHSLAGALTLGRFAAMISLAPLIITNNSAPAHLAAAVGTPVVDLYALTNPQHTPWQVPCRVLFHPVPCRFCYKSICPEQHHDCLAKVTPERVVTETLGLLQEVSRSTRNDINGGIKAIENERDTSGAS